MKKLLLIASLSLVGMGLKAQETTFGVKGGYSLSTMKITAGVDDLGERSMDPAHTFYIGGMVEHKFGSKFGVQGEVLYSPLGAKETFSEGNLKIKNTISLGTVLVPVSAKYFINDKLAVSAGASFGVILSAKQKIEGEESNDIKDDLKPLNIAPFIGAEYMIKNGFFVDARYNVGVANILKEGPGSAKNSFGQIGIGYKFGKK